MTLNGNKFEGTVEFNTDRDNYDGCVTLSDGWVYILETQEYIPREKIDCIKHTGQHNTNMV